MDIVRKAESVLDKMSIAYKTAYLSCHRNHEDVDLYLSDSTADVFIAVAGLSAHLPGYVAARTNKPVIGVPVDKGLGGLDALLSIVQMPKGVPVACIGINNAENAAILAAEILSLKDEDLQNKVALYKKGAL
jgi:5-(carboxyamino)imidazole ribonucleotide mutase